jgi:molecular chaperone DnaK
VSAKDLGTGKEQTIKITAKSGLSEEEIKKMVRDAELHAEDDKARKERATVANDLDNLTYQTEKIVKENEASFNADDVKLAREIIGESRELLANKESKADTLKSAYERLQNISHKLSTELYSKGKAAGEQAAPTEGAAAEGGGEAKSGDDVIDADYKDVR